MRLVKLVESCKHIHATKSKTYTFALLMRLVKLVKLVKLGKLVKLVNSFMLQNQRPKKNSLQN